MNRPQGQLRAALVRRSNRLRLVIGGAAAILLAAAVAALLAGQESNGANLSGALPSPDSTAAPAALAPAATLIFDRGGPDGGVALGALNVPGIVPYEEGKARLFIDHQVEPRLVRMCLAGWLPSPPPGQDCVEHVHTAGYRVTSTLDWAATVRAMDLLEESILSGLVSGCDCHEGAVVTIEPQTGEVVVYVPNRGADGLGDTRVRRDIDQLTEINTPGTAFMPVAFLAWFDRLGKAPMSTLWDTSPLPIPGSGTITNPRADGGSEGLISARAALAAMQEVPAFRATEEVGVDAVTDIAAKLGITTLAMNFDPTWLSHADVLYGPNLGNAGVNVRAFDVAYMNATIANMGLMVGTPNLASVLDLSTLQSTSSARDRDYDEALRQVRAFQRGDTRLPGTRELDPIVVLEVADRDGNVLFAQGEPERRQVVDAGSVWLLHTIMSDCTARFIIWGCGKDNLDLALDFSMNNGQRVPAGVQFGRIAFPPDPTRSLEVWMTGYSKYAATVVWAGNFDNGLVNDGPAHNYASSNTVVRFWKAWMGTYHDTLQARGEFSVAAGFEDLQPGNVTFGPFRTTSTDRVLVSADGNDFNALCEQIVNGWFRTDVQYASECEPVEIDTRDGSRATAETPDSFRAVRQFRSLPQFLPASARALADELGIPVAPLP